MLGRSHRVGTRLLCTSTAVETAPYCTPICFVAYTYRSWLQKRRKYILSHQKIWQRILGVTVKQVFWFDLYVLNTLNAIIQVLLSGQVYRVWLITLTLFGLIFYPSVCIYDKLWNWWAIQNVCNHYLCFSFIWTIMDELTEASYRWKHWKGIISSFYGSFDLSVLSRWTYLGTLQPRGQKKRRKKEKKKTKKICIKSWCLTRNLII